ATNDLSRTMLLDSAFIQEKDADFFNRKIRKSGEEKITPLYTVEDVDSVLPQFVGVGYYRPFEFCEMFQGTFIEAGHILGSAQVQVDVDMGTEKKHRVVFSGDIGRNEQV